MLVEHALEPLIGWDGFELTRKVLVFLLRLGGDEAVAEIGAPLQETSPAPCIAALLGRGDPGGHEPAHDHLRGLALFGAALDQEIDHSSDAGEEVLARRTVLTPVCGAPPLRLRLGPAKARLKIDERLQILLQEALLGKLGDGTGLRARSCPRSQARADGPGAAL